MKHSMLKAFLFLGFVLSIVPVAEAQRADPADPANMELGKELLKKAVAARGGSKYEQITTITATGQYTPFIKGSSQIPIQFLDIIVYPDNERVEFGKGKKKNRRIQVNTGSTGWVYDGDAETLKDQTEQQINDYLESLEYDIDRLLRGIREDAGVEIRFYGREELRPGERADVVLIQVRPGRTAYLWLSPINHLPINLIYEKTGDGRLVKHEVRFHQYVTYDGVMFPNIVDFFRDGIQEGRVNYQSIRLNEPVSADQFAKPANIKAIK